MKRTIKPQTAAAVVVLALALGAALWSLAPKPGPDKPTGPGFDPATGHALRAPVGMTMARDAGPLSPGTTLYTVDGLYVGSVTGSDPAYALPGGVNGPAVSIVHDASTGTT